MKIMQKVSIAILSTGMLASSFAVPLVNLKAGVGYQMLSPSGYVNYDGDNIDVEKDLKWDDSKSAYGFVEVGLPVIPNIRLEYLPTLYEGTGTVDKTLKFGNITLGTVRDRVYSKFDVNQYDAVAYYSLPVPFVKPRLGLAVKVLDGNVYVKSLTTQQEENVDLTIPIPLVYGGVSINLPVIPIGLDIDGKGITDGKSYLLDVKGLLKYTLVGIPLIGKAYIGGGYRYQRFRLKDIDIDGKKLNTDLKFGGILVEAGVEF